MQVTLNKAVKLRNKLETALSGFTLNRKHTTRYEDESSVREESNDATGDSKTSLKQFIEDQENLFKMRSLIQSLNVSSGVNDLISKMAMHQRVVSFLSKSQPNDEYDYHRVLSLDEIVDDMNYKIELAGSKDEPFKVEQVTFKLDGVDEYCEELLKFHRAKCADLEEERNKINHNTTLEIPESIVETLRRRDII